MNLTDWLVCRWERGRCSDLGVSGLNDGMMMIPLTDTEGKCAQDWGLVGVAALRVRKM